MTKEEALVVMRRVLDILVNDAANKNTLLREIERIEGKWGALPVKYFLKKLHDYADSEVIAEADFLIKELAKINII